MRWSRIGGTCKTSFKRAALSLVTVQLSDRRGTNKDYAEIAVDRIDEENAGVSMEGKARDDVGRWGSEERGASFQTRYLSK